MQNKWKRTRWSITQNISKLKTTGEPWVKTTERSCNYPKTRISHKKYNNWMIIDKKQMSKRVLWKSCVLVEESEESKIIQRAQN